MEEHTRGDTYRRFSSYFLYGSQSADEKCKDSGSMLNQDLNPNVQSIDQEVERVTIDTNDIISYSVNSEFQDKKTVVRVLLPRDIDKARRILFTLPVHPELSMKYGDGLLEIMNLNLHNKYDFITVAPSFSDMPWFVDHPSNPTLRQESYMMKVVVPLIDRYHPIDDPKRLLLGFSKSGFGAVSLILRHSSVFDAASVWDASMLRDRPLPDALARIVGTPDNFEQYRISSALRKNCDRFRQRKRLAFFGYGILREDLHQAHRLMCELGILHHYVDGPQRDHSWGGGWVEEAVQALDAMTKEVTVK